MQFSHEGLSVRTSVSLSSFSTLVAYSSIPEMVVKVLQLVRHVFRCFFYCLMTERHWPWVCHEVVDPLYAFSVRCGNTFLGVGVVFSIRSVQKLS